MNKEDGTKVEPPQPVNPIELVSFDGEVSLRQMTLQDAGEVFEVIDRNRDFLSQHHEDTAQKYPYLSILEESITHPKNPDRLRFAIRNRQGQVVGSINITPDKKTSGEAEIGYWQGEEFKGNGYVGRAVETLTSFAFNTLHLKTVYGVIFETNEPSMRVLTRAGFTRGAKNEKGYTRFTKNA